MWKLDYKESWVPKNWCFWTVVLEKTLESPLDCKEIQSVHPKGDQPWAVIGRTDAEAETLAIWCKELTPLKTPWCWERLKARGEGDDKGWDGWMASPTWWTWGWVNSRSWWWTWRPGLLQSMGSQIVGHDWATELNWTDTGISLALYTTVSARELEGWLSWEEWWHNFVSESPLCLRTKLWDNGQQLAFSSESGQEIGAGALWKSSA